MALYPKLLLIVAVILVELISGNIVVASSKSETIQGNTLDLKNKLLFLRYRDIWAHDFEKQTDIQLTHSKSITNYAVSSEASKIAYFKNNKTLYLFDIKTGAEEFIAEAATDSSQPSISPNGDKITFVAFSKNKILVKMSNYTKGVKKAVRHIWIVDVKTKNVVDVTKNLPFSHSQVNWSPDGRWLSFASFRWIPQDLSNPYHIKNWKVYLMDLKTPEYKTQEIGGGSSSLWLNNNQVIVSDGVAANVLTIYDVNTKSKTPTTMFKAGFSAPVFSFGGINNEMVYYEAILNSDGDGLIRSYNTQSQKTKDVVPDASVPRYIK